MASTTRRSCWTLEVIRGREVGRRYVVAPGETVIGNDVKQDTGLDLADQEPSSPRRMAARQACVTALDGTLSIRDLESPGGTFVNRQRLLSGQSRILRPGDLIQLGAVQLQVKEEPAAIPVSQPNAPARSQGAPSADRGGSLTIPFRLAEGATCRSWDDFLVLAAQRWPALRDELTSGRLAEHLRRIQRTELLPRSEANQTADERLDAWLAMLPTSRSSAPELEVHPRKLDVRPAGSGGTVHQTIRITNVGFRLLRSTVRVEPPGTTWIRIAPKFTGGSFFTIEETDVLVEIEIAEDLDSARHGTVVVESNGGCQRIEVQVERSPEAGRILGSATGPIVINSMSWTRPIAEWLALSSTGKRLVYGGLTLIMFRLLALLAKLIPLGASGGGLLEPQLAPLALLLAGVGSLLGGWLSVRRRDVRGLPSSAFTGGLGGVFAAALEFALIRGVEGLLGPWSSSPLVVLLFWGGLGVGTAWITCPLVPPRLPDPTPEPRP